LGYFILDNISSNDTCVREILRNLRPDLDPIQRHFRCFGHIVNLAAKTFLFGKEPEAFETNDNSLPGQEEKDLAKLRPLGKIRNVVVHIRKTPQRREAFLKMAGLEGESDGARGKITSFSFLAIG
jgi:hypothetical protein